MREVSEKAKQLLEDGSYSIEWVADLFYDGSPVAQGMAVVEPEFSWDLGSQVQGKGSCTILWDDDFGGSAVPQQIGDLLSPFGAELQVDVIVSAGAFRERISIGRFVLDSVPAASEYAIDNPRGGLPVVVESQVGLSLADYFLRISRDKFPFPTSPQSTSMWDEAQRLTGLPVFQSIPDRVISRSMTYDEDRLDALEKLIGSADAWPALTSSGALTAIPKSWGAPVGRIESAVAVTGEMRSLDVYNRVVVEGKSPGASGPPLLAVAEITDGMLRVRNADGSRSPFAGNTYRYQSDLFTDVAQCQKYADELLPKVSRLRAVTKTITEPFNPLREVGDVLVFSDPSRVGDESLVRVTGVSHRGGETTTVVEVAA